MPWLMAVVLFTLLALSPLDGWSQTVPPPNFWHPYLGGTNCLQVADARGNFNCAPGTTVDPATGNMVISGTLAFVGLLPGTFVKGILLAPVTTSAQLLGSSDLVIATSPRTVARSGPLIQGATLRVRQVGPGNCQLVVAGGNSFDQEFIIPVIDPDSFQSAGFGRLTAPLAPYSTLLSFPGGPGGC